MRTTARGTIGGLATILIAFSSPGVGSAGEPPDLETFRAGRLQFPGESWTLVERPEEWGWSSALLAEARRTFEQLDSASVLAELERMKTEPPDSKEFANAQSLRVGNFGLALETPGAVMDALALLLITIPIFFPVAIELGYDPIWFGVTITVVTTLGAVTPPVGATTYVVGGMAKDVPLQDVFKGVAYFLPAYVLCILILMMFPGLVTFLPSMLK